MSQAELLRVEVCVRVVSGEFCVAEAAMRLGLSYRHMKRLLRRYRERGATGLMHQSVGRSSNRSRPLVEIRVRALDLIREHYGGPPEERFGPTLAAEHLESEHGLKVCSETLRLWMLEAGLWSLSRGGASLTASAGSAGRTLVSWCRWMGASTDGWRIAARRVA
jgi:transposase